MERSTSGLTQLILGESASIESVRRDILRVAESETSVLIEGETGTGKELVARAIHMASGRTGALVPVNMLAVPSSMFEATMFGHVRGAFTGAVGDLPGYMAEAEHGTLFLDELAGLEHAHQGKLLRALETQRYRPVGARADKPSDVRLVSASNVPVADLVARGDLRRDLRHRLANVMIRIPPLRDRIGDARFLASLFLRDASAEKAWSNEALLLIEEYDWPGNVRELRNVVSAVVLLTDAPEISREMLLRQLETPLIPRSAHYATRTLRETLQAVEDANGDITAAARALGVNRTTVYRRIRGRSR